MEQTTEVSANISTGSWHSYPSIYAMGHRYIEDLLNHDVIVEEKVDGSQFSFMKTESGELKIRSKGATMWIDAPEGMFNRAAATVKEIADLLYPGWTYRAEYLAKPKHNALAYDRVPNKHLIIFDINTGHESYMGPNSKRDEAHRIGLECVPVLFTGHITSPEQFRAFLERESVLGGQKIEGVVVKPFDYGLFGADKKVLLGKFVSEAFKETHAREWKKENPGTADVVASIAEQYRVPARWAKAVQHLRERGELTDSPKDIGNLLKEIVADVRKECEHDIKDQLFTYAWKQIGRVITHGAPEWYKDQLLLKQFDQE